MDNLIISKYLFIHTWLIYIYKFIYICICISILMYVCTHSWMCLNAVYKTCRHMCRLTILHVCKYACFEMHSLHIINLKCPWGEPTEAHDCSCMFLLSRYVAYMQIYQNFCTPYRHTDTDFEHDGVWGGSTWQPLWKEKFGRSIKWRGPF